MAQLLFENMAELPSVGRNAKGRFVKVAQFDTELGARHGADGKLAATTGIHRQDTLWRCGPIQTILR
jgi:hypothetical protein